MNVHCCSYSLSMKSILEGGAIVDNSVVNCGRLVVFSRPNGNHIVGVQFD